jgi:hypothetical protein
MASKPRRKSNSPSNLRWRLHGPARKPNFTTVSAHVRRFGDPFLQQHFGEFFPAALAVGFPYFFLWVSATYDQSPAISHLRSNRKGKILGGS